MLLIFKISLNIMEKKSEKVASIANMFENVDIDVIENILDMCKGKVNKAVEVLLKMQDDSASQPAPTEIKDRQLNDNFLELDDTEDQALKKSAESFASENYEIEQEYNAEIQKAIELSLKITNPPSGKAPADKNKPGSNKHSKIPEKPKPSKKGILSAPKENPDEEVIQFIFRDKILARGENISRT
jgi:hypothetical protein